MDIGPLTARDYHAQAAAAAERRSLRFLMLPGRRRELRELARLHALMASGTPVAVPRIDFEQPTGSPLCEARIGYGLTVPPR